MAAHNIGEADADPTEWFISYSIYNRNTTEESQECRNQDVLLWGKGNLALQGDEQFNNVSQLCSSHLKYEVLDGEKEQGKPLPQAAAPLLLSLCTCVYV